MIDWSDGDLVSCASKVVRSSDTCAIDEPHGVYFGWLRRSADPRFDRHREGRMEQQRQTCSKRGFHGQSSRPMGQDGVGSTNVGVGLEKFERVYRRPRLYRLGCGSDLEGFSLAVD